MNDRHHHNQVTLRACVSLTFSLSLSLSLSPCVPIIHRSRQVLPTTSSVQSWCKFLMVDQHWHVHVLGPQNNVAYEFVPASPAVSHMSRSSWTFFEKRGRWSYNCYLVGRCCQDLFKIAFSVCVLLASTRYIYTVVLTKPQLGRNTVLFHRID